MSFDAGLSGLSAASKSLDVIGNNIANANTVGMKAGRTEFAQMISTAIGLGGGGSNSGIGVSVANVSQNFSQGSINITNNSLDVAVNGNGFFTLSMPDGTTAYSRDGQFKLTSDGKIVTNSGGQVMGFPTDTAGKVTSESLKPMTLPTAKPIKAQATTKITSELNLDARAPVATTTTPPTMVSTYATSLNAYDSLGGTAPVNFYFVKTDVNTWAAYTDATEAQTRLTADGTANPAAITEANADFVLVFNTDGTLSSPTTAPNISVTPTTAGAQSPMTVAVDVSGITQFGSNFAITNLTQNGYATGELTGVKIDETGVITSTYSNGQTQSSGRIALADFRNVQGLVQSNGGNWVETFASGQPVPGRPGAGKFGALQSGALEQSNVDLTSELVNMMTAQRAYQANAQTIKTQDQVMSTLVNLR